MAHKHKALHDGVTILIWVVVAYLAFRFIPALISDISVAAAPLLSAATGGATPSTPSTASNVNGASPTTSLPPAYSSLPNSGSVSTAGTAPTPSGTGTVVPGTNFIVKLPGIWGLPPRAFNPGGGAVFTFQGG